MNLEMNYILNNYEEKYVNYAQNLISAFYSLSAVISRLRQT